MDEKLVNPADSGEKLGEDLALGCCGCFGGRKEEESLKRGPRGTNSQRTLSSEGRERERERAARINALIIGAEQKWGPPAPAGQLCGS